MRVVRRNVVTPSPSKTRVRRERRFVIDSHDHRVLLPQVIYPSSRKIRLIGYGRKTAAYKLQARSALSIRRSIIDTSSRDSLRKMFFIRCLRAPLPNSCKFQVFRKSRILPRIEYKLDATIQSWRLAALFLINLLLGQVKHGEVCSDLCAGN